MRHGKCNCGKPATSTWIIKDKKSAREIGWCDDCKPERSTDTIYEI